MLVVMGLAVLAGISWGPTADPEDGLSHLLPGNLGVILSGASAALAFIGSVLWTLERRTGGDRLCILIACMTTAVLCGSIRVPSGGPATLEISLVLSELITAGLLGGMLCTMLLGHWYLTAPTMSIAPLVRLTRILGVVVFLRFLTSAWVLSLSWSEINGTTYQLWLSLRWGAGIMGPAIVVFMVSRILGYRNTQSATGVLFVGVILTFIGEMTAALLFNELQLPL